MFWAIIVILIIAVGALYARIQKLEKQAQWLVDAVAGKRDSSGRILAMGIYDWVQNFKSANFGNTPAGDPDTVKPPVNPPPSDI